MNYNLGWMDKLTNVHFGDGNSYIAITVAASKSVAGTQDNLNPAIPPRPVVALSFGNGQKLVQAIHSPPITGRIPERLVQQNLYFVWMGAAPFPVATTFGITVFQIGGIVSYGGQFSLALDINNGGFNYITPPPGANVNTGTYSSFAEAQAGAANLNSRSPLPKEFITYFSSDHGGVNTAFAPFFGATLDIPYPVPGSATIGSTDAFVVSIPPGSGSLSVTVDDSSQISAGIWVKQKSGITDQFALTGPGSATGALGSFSGTTYTISWSQGQSPTLAITGGGGGGGGPSV